MPWLYSAADEVFIACDDPRSVRHEAEYVDDEDFGGVTFRELNADHNGTLADAMHAGLGNGEGHFKSNGNGHGKGHGD